MDILIIKSWVSVILAVSGIFLLLNFVFCFLIVSNVNSPIPNKIFDNILKYNLVIFSISVLLLGIICGYTSKC